MLDTERRLREMLWLKHGCNDGSIAFLYGDDGEMQCHKCGSDFLRQSLSCIAENIESPFPGNYYKEKPTTAGFDDSGPAPTEGGEKLCQTE